MMSILLLVSTVLNLCIYAFFSEHPPMNLASGILCGFCWIFDAIMRHK